MKVMLALAAEQKKYLPGGLMVRLVRNYPDIRDLAQRLLHLPVIKRGNFVTNLPQNDLGLIKFAEANKYSLYMGYRVYKEKDKDQMDTLLMCVDQKGCVVESEKQRLDSTVYYVGIRVPADDIPSRRYASKFNRMDYIKGL
jgi:hypothetical protein|uniref:Uncharacterized protein n=1 Tax=Myoviridae sp. ctshb19 TaxID=2825194 RepID=A0A8S5UGY9_9CAUD|nr:MAG TPA: hypothetical protein [Myoviridae sp. ctshb19]